MKTRLIAISILACLGATYALIPVLKPAQSPAEQFEQAANALDQGETTGVAQALRTLRPLPEFSAHVKLLDAGVFRLAGKPDDALRELYTIPHVEELTTHVLFQTAATLYDLKNFPQAEILFRTLVAEHPDTPDYRRWLGAIYFDIGAYDAAITELLVVADLAPDDYRPYRLLGLMHSDFSQFKEAISEYQMALDRNPPADIAATIRLKLAAALVEQREFDSALQILQESNGTTTGKVLMARCYWNKGEQQKAEHHLELARKMDADDRELLMLTAEMQTANGDASAAVKTMRHATTMYPMDAECRYSLALSLRDSGLADEAATEMKNWEERKQLATQLTELNIKAIQNPADTATRDQLAEVCERLGRNELAIMWRQAADALRAAPTEPSTSSEQPEG